MTQKVQKKYINVIAYIDKTGKVMPLTIVDEKGMKYRVDQVFYIDNATSRAGGCGVRFKCSINGKIRNLFYEIDRWFIESYCGL